MHIINSPPCLRYAAQNTAKPKNNSGAGQAENTA
jgi:hypothetical protein